MYMCVYMYMHMKDVQYMKSHIQSKVDTTSYFLDTRLDLLFPASMRLASFGKSHYFDLIIKPIIAYVQPTR